MAVTLAHELQHAKLNALVGGGRAGRPATDAATTRPGAPDPRPLFGLLHGAYAHAGLAGFWRRHAEDSALGLYAQVEFSRWREAAHQVTGTLLDSGGLTEAGTHFVAMLRDTLGRWQAEPVAPSHRRPGSPPVRTPSAGVEPGQHVLTGAGGSDGRQVEVVRPAG